MDSDGSLATSRAAEAEGVVKQHMWIAAGVSLVPVPIVDIALVMGVHLNMVRSLAERYGTPFSADIGKSLIASIVGGTLAGPAASLAKLVPVVGSLVSAVSLPLLAGASTYAIGKVFIQHFESGGTFLTLDPEKVRGYYARQFAQGKAEVSRGYAGVRP